MKTSYFHFSIAAIFKGKFWYRHPDRGLKYPDQRLPLKNRILPATCFSVRQENQRFSNNHPYHACLLSNTEPSY